MRNIRPDNTNVFRFLQKSYDEAFELLIYAHDYLSREGRNDKILLSKEEQLTYTLAASTITTQLTSVMSWLLTCKAVEAGEITSEQIENTDFNMPEFNLGIYETDSCFATLSTRMKDLFSKSSSLYNRVKRLETSIKRQLVEVV